MTVPNNFGRSTLNFSLCNGVPGAVVLHWFKSDLEDVSELTLTDMNAAIESWWTDSLGGQVGRAFFNNNTTLENIVSTAFRQTPQLQDELIVGTAGTATGIALPAETAVVVSWYTNTAGRSYRGRTYWPGPDPDQLGNDGQLTAAFQTNWTATMEQLRQQIGGVDAGNVDFAIYSRKLDVMTQIQSKLVRRTLHHQSRRNT